jgi:hypothetical protein
MSRGLHAVADDIEERKAAAADREWFIGNRSRVEL